MKQQSHDTTFEFIGGQLCLDFANTVGGLRGAVEHEHLTSYADLVRWSVATEILTPQAQRDLVIAADVTPDAGAAILRRALTLREAIYEIFTAIAAAAPPPNEAMNTLNQELQLAMVGVHIAAAMGGFVWAWDSDATTMDQVLCHIARSAAQLLTTADVHLVRTCAGDSCGWLFVDATRNHRRQWCTMTGCGNKARVRRHRQRVRADGADSTPAGE